MRERAAAAGCQLDIQSTPDSGTTLLFKFAGKESQ
jgi:signal transduction histidine kinase